MRRTVLVFAVLALCTAVTVGKDHPAKDDVDPALRKTVGALVKQLDDPSFEVREKATVALIALGPKAGPVLRDAMNGLSVEAMSRIRRVLLAYREVERREALGSPVQGEWPMLKRGPGRCASDGLDSIRKTPKLRWARDLPFVIGRPYFDSPLFAVGDRLVVVGRTGMVAACSRKTGEVQWRTDTGGPVFAAPVMAGDSIFVPGRNLTAIDSRDGHIQWRWKTDYGCVASPLAFGGKIYAVDQGEKIAALDPATGKETWKLRLQATNSAPVAVGDLIVLGTRRGLVAFGASDGRLRWRFRTEAPVTSSPAVLPDRVVFGDDRANVYAVSVDHGRKIWRRGIPEGCLWETPAVYGDAVLFATTGATFRALRAADGMDLWTRFVGALHVSSPAVCGGVAYFTAGPDIHAMDCSNGDDLWRRELVSQWSSPVLVHGNLYLVSWEGILACLE